MRWPAWISVFILLFLTVGITVAAEPAVILLSANPEWIVADGTSRSIISATVLDTENNPVPDYDVSFFTDPVFGTVALSKVKTDINGTASTTFSVLTKSGNTYVAAISGNTTNITTVYIDHNVPYEMKLFYEHEVTLGTITKITAHLEDKFHNPIDNRSSLNKDLEYVDFKLVGAPVNTEIIPGFLFNGTIQKNLFDQYTDENGNITVDFQTASKQADHLISIVPNTTVLFPKLIVIRSTASGIPVSLDQIVNPASLYQPADNKHNFTINYYLFDEFGNKLVGYDIILNITQPDGSFSISGISTSILGYAVLEYGPRSEPGIVKIVAEVEENATLSSSAILDFYDPAPVNIDLMSLPSMLPSREVPSNLTSRIIAKVTDEKGRGVQGEPVNFTLVHPIDYPDCQLDPPYIEGAVGNITQNITDLNGLCEVTFVPGLFVEYGEPNYSKFGNASADVMSSWDCEKDGIIKTDNVTIGWKNFPYLSVLTEVSNETVEENQTIDVTIKIMGEGLPINFREPVDLVLATARAWSMLEENPDRMTYAYIAEHTLIDLLKRSDPIPGTKDAIGLLTSGGNPHGIADIKTMDKQFRKYAGDDNTEDLEGEDGPYIDANYIGSNVTSYDNWVTWEQTFTSGLDIIDGKINLTTPWDDKKFSQYPSNPVRKSLYEGISGLRNQSNNFKAIVLLVDSDISDYGDPLAEGNPDYKWAGMTGGTNRYYPFLGPDGDWDPDSDNEPLQNMAVYARSENVRIYVVYAASQINNADQVTYQTLASYTGGKYYPVTEGASQLVDIYQQIAEELIDLAAMRSIMNIDMGVVEVNGDPVVQENSSIFRYVHENVTSPYSTYIEFYYTVNNTPIRDPEILDQSDDYCDPEGECDHTLTFEVGNISVGQTWQARYRLLVNVTGEINIFGNESAINFTNPYFGDLSYEITERYITVLPLENLQQKTEDLTIREFCCIDEGCHNACTVSDEIPISWIIDYSGNKTVTQKLYIRDASGGKWKQFEVRHTLGNTNSIANFASLTTRSLQNGVYQLRLEAYAPDAPRRSKEIVITVQKSPFFILLK